MTLFVHYHDGIQVLYESTTGCPVCPEEEGNWENTPDNPNIILGEQ